LLHSWCWFSPSGIRQSIRRMARNHCSGQFNRLCRPTTELLSPAATHASQSRIRLRIQESGDSVL